MKPCPMNRKPIAWLVVNALNPREAAALHEHLARCEGCRRYCHEMSNMAARLASAAPDSAIEASDFFHRRVSARLRAAESRSLLETLALWLRDSVPGWRVVLPAAGLALIAAVTVIALRQHVNPSRLVVQTVAETGFETDQAATLANYRIAACQSVDKFSELLSVQGSRPLPPAPAYSASGLGPLN